MLVLFVLLLFPSEGPGVVARAQEALCRKEGLVRQSPAWRLWLGRGTPAARLGQSCLSTGSHWRNGVRSQFASRYSAAVNIIYGRKSL